MADDTQTPKKRELPGPSGLYGLVTKPIEAIASRRKHVNRTRGAGAGGLAGGVLGSFFGLVGAGVGAAVGATLGAWFGASRDDDDASDVLTDTGEQAA